MNIARPSTRALPVAFLVLVAVLLAALPGAARADVDPLVRGPYATTSLDPFTAGTVNLQEPNAAGGPAPAGSTTSPAGAVSLQIRGSLYRPVGRTQPSPVLVLVHGNHGSCDSIFGPDGRTTALNPATGRYEAIPQPSGPTCTVGNTGTGPTYFKRNDRGYAYLGQNLASWGYTVVSIDQDQLIFYQDSNMAKGMHQRRLLIAATLDALYKANTEGLTGTDQNIGDTLKGTLDFTRIGLMGHSRGGDAVTSFIDYNRTRPAPGRRYDLRGVIALSPVDYERRAPYGMAYMAAEGLCDGDVSNMQGARFFERSQYIDPSDPFPRILVNVQGANHNWFNTVWAADGEDGSDGDKACGVGNAYSDTANPNTPVVTNTNNVRMSGGISTYTGDTTGRTSGASGGGTYTLDNRGDGDPALMGDQEKVGLAVMASFFRRYVGGEGGFDQYMTGERNAAGQTELPTSACPNQKVSGTGRPNNITAPSAANPTPTNPTGAPIAGQVDGTRLACDQRILTSYFAAPAERRDVIRPETDDPLGTSAVGTALVSSGFTNPYLDGGGVSPKPATTGTGLDWCNPEPDDFAPGQLGKTSYPTAKKACPLPGVTALGGQSATRENGPINQSYGLQLAAAWDDPVGTTGKPASISTRIPAADGDVSGLRALALGAGVNFFDPRNIDPLNPDRSTITAATRVGSPAEYDPTTWTQDFRIVLTDAAGHEGVVSAADKRYGEALHPSLGSTTSKTHVLLNQVRVPLADFAAQGVDLRSVRKVELRFGEAGTPKQGSVQLSDVRFQEATTGTGVLQDTPGTSGPATGAPKSGPDPAALIAATPRRAASSATPDAVGTTVSPVACVDTKAPKAAVTSLRTVRGRLALKGRASDLGCIATRGKAEGRASTGKVRSVQVTLSRRSGKTCRFVRGTGRLTKAAPCSSPYGLVAKGTSRWSLTTSGRPAKGRYVLTVRAFDAAGNVAATKARTVRIG